MRSFIVYSERCAFRRPQMTPHATACGPSIAGFGVVGPCGPRTGNSSGILPGNSSGRGVSPGSRTGGGTSGRGLPGGASGGGSVGFPGVAGGISGGSIGIACIVNQIPPSGFIPAGSAITAGMKRCSRSRRHGTCDIRSRDRVRVMFLTATCCCGSCQPRHSPAIACRRCNRPAIRCATDVRSPPRAARATAALA